VSGSLRSVLRESQRSGILTLTLGKSNTQGIECKKGDRKMKKIVSIVFLLTLLVGVPALAAGFPAGTCATTDGYYSTPYNCNVQITANPDGTLSFYINNPNPYEGSDDMQVGFYNNSGATINAITLSGTAVANGGIFGYDGDDSNWDPSYITTTNIGYDTFGDAVSGQINFAGGVPDQGTAWFNLEETPNGGTFGGNVGPVPEPSSFLLLGSGLALLVKRLIRA